MPGKHLLDRQVVVLQRGPFGGPQCQRVAKVQVLQELLGWIPREPIGNLFPVLSSVLLIGLGVYDSCSCQGSLPLQLPDRCTPWRAV